MQDSNEPHGSGIPAAPVWLTLVLGLALAALLGWGVHSRIARDAAQHYEEAASRLAESVHEHLDTLGLLLRSAAGLVSASDTVTRSDWRRYVEQLELSRSFPGLQGVGYVPLIQPAALPAFEAAVRAEGFAAFRVTPTEPRAVYSSILFLEPFDARNQRAFGYDMYSDATRRAAMDAARDSGQPQLSARVQLLQETDSDVQAGTLMYFPVYRNALALASVVQRRQELAGWTYSPLRMGDFMRGLLQQWDPTLTRNLRLHVYDGTTPDAATLLYTSTPDQPYVPAATHGLNSHQHQLVDFNGRQWLLVFDFDPASAGLSTLIAWYTLAGGVVITLLLAGLQLSLQQTRRRADRIAARLTADIVAQDQRLRESEFRWKFALEGAGDGVWDWNLESNAVYFSPRWKAMLGFADHEIRNHLDEWSRRVHPDDRDAVTREVTDYLEGRSERYCSEHRVQCKDGSYRWILDRGMVVARDASGKPLRMIGLHSDIEARKQAEQQLRDSMQDLQRLHYALDQLDTYVYLKDSESRYTYANQHCLGLFNLTAESIRGKTDFDFFPPETAQQLRAIDQRVLAGHSTQEEITMGSGADQRVYLELKTPLRERGNAGRIIGLCGISTDITARKQLEQTLQQQQHDLAEAQRIGLMGSWSLDLASGAVQWSDQLYAMFRLQRGTQPPTLAEQQKIFAPGSFELLTAAVRSTTEQGTPYELELETVAVDGSRGWMLARGEAVRDAGGRVTALRGIAQDITPRKQAELRIARLTNLYTALNALHRLMTSCRSEDELYRQTCDIIISHGGLQMAWIGMVERGGVKVLPVHAAGSGTDYLDGIEISVDAGDPHGRGATGTAIRENRPVWVDDFRSSPIAAPWQQRAADFGWGLSAALPICRAGRPIGAVTFYSIERAGYDDELRSLLEEMSRAISHTLDRLDAEALAYDSASVMQKIFLQTVGLATHLVELRDPYTAGHVQRVARLCEAIGRELGLVETRLQGLRVAGQLYDIGKILIPAEILSKPGRLSAMEHQLIRQHPQAGFQLLQNVDFPWPVAQAALQHHERLDGSGYPQGLKGDSILLEARIIGLADVVVAMVSHRPWRAALPLARALEDVEAGRGSRYDADVADACLRLLREGRITL